MLKYFRRQFNISCVVADLVALLVSFAASFYLRRDIVPFLSISLSKRPMFGLSYYLPILFLCSFTILVVLLIFKAYRQAVSLPLSLLFLLNLRGVTGAFLVTLSLAYLLRLTFLSRLFLVLFFGTFLLLSTTLKYAVTVWFRKGLREGRLFRAALLVGADRRARVLADKLLQRPELGLKIRGFMCVEGEDDPAEAKALKEMGLECLGDVSALTGIVEREVIDGVIFCVRPGTLAHMEDLFLACEDLGVDTLLATNLFPHLTAQVHLERIEELALLRFTTIPHNQTALFCKRAMDVLVSASTLVVISPLLLAITALVKFTSRGPVLFDQERMGLNGRLFTCIKFRTMREDAEDMKSILEDLNEADGPVFKIKDDPRITRLGRILRKFSLDELPQLWNVFVGQMSLVGPRPPIPSEVAHYERWQRRRLSMRPGLTCLWQISGRSELDFDTWMKLDLHYIDHWSLLQDFIIILKTIPAVISTRGAA